MISRLILTGLVTTALGACLNPVHQDAVSDLGDEVSGIRPGPRHRAGQPCLTCHGGSGSGSPEFAAAGTIYAARDNLVGLAGVTVVLTDRNGSTKTAVSNDVGNFYIEAERWTPIYPVKVELQSGAFTKEMKTLIGRNGGCGNCHRAGGDASHNPAVFLKDIGE